MKTAALYLVLLLLTCALGQSPTKESQATSAAENTLLPSSRRLDFGSQAVLATSAPLLMDVKNTGASSVVIQRVFASSEEFSLTQNCSTGRPLPGHEACTITVSFTPQEVGAHKGAITILVQDHTLLNIELFGNGVESNVSLSNNHFVFRDQLVNTHGDLQMLRVENLAATPLSIKNIEISPEFTLLETPNECPTKASLSAKSSCNLAVRFSPESEGLVSGYITIEDSDRASPHRVGLSGRATAVKLSIPSLIWDSVAVGVTGIAQDVQISNQGHAILHIDNIDARGDFIQHNTCRKELASQQSCTVTAVFQPRSIGKSAGSIRIRDSDVTAMQTVFLTGNAVALELSPAKIDFGQSGVDGSSPIQTVMITNHGDKEVNLRSIGVKGDFAMPSKSCGDVLKTNQSCKVSLNFQPTTAGERAGALTIETDAGNAQTVALIGVGVQNIAK